MSNARPGESKGADAGKSDTREQPPDVSADRNASDRPGKATRQPLPIDEIEKEEEDSKGG